MHLVPSLLWTSKLRLMRIRSPCGAYYLEVHHYNHSPTDTRWMYNDSPGVVKPCLKVAQNFLWISRHWRITGHDPTLFTGILNLKWLDLLYNELVSSMDWHDYHLIAMIRRWCKRKHWIYLDILLILYCTALMFWMKISFICLFLRCIVLHHKNM